MRLKKAWLSAELRDRAGRYHARHDPALRGVRLETQRAFEIEVQRMRDQFLQGPLSRLAEPTLGAIVDAGMEGLIHASAGGECSWYDLARALLDSVGRSGYPLKPIPTTEYPLPAQRPAYSVLANRHLALTIGDVMPSWQEGLAAYLARRGG